LAATDQIAAAKRKIMRTLQGSSICLNKQKTYVTKSAAELMHIFVRVFMHEKPNCHAKTPPGEHHGGRELQQPFSP
jgi:hypothetical protein